MTEAVFKASYADWKLIKTRKVVQVVFEVPVESSDIAYQVVGGMADNSQEKWFAIARLDESPPKPEGKAPLKWQEMSPAQQAGMLCSDIPFQKFILETGGSTDAANSVRLICGVTSRGDIKPGTEAARRWASIVSDYRAWQHEPEFVGRDE